MHKLARFTHDESVTQATGLGMLDSGYLTISHIRRVFY